MKPVLFLFFISVSLAASGQVMKSSPKAKASVVDFITYRIFINPDSTYGYEVLKNGKVLVHQPTVPGRTPERGFVSRNDAAKTGRLAVTRVKKYEGPPQITEEDLKRMNIR